MSGVASPAALVTVVLWLLAAYHLTLGSAALFVPAVAPRVMRAIYGMTLPDGDAWRYMVSMIGALALAIGILATTAALAPAEHAAIVGALLALQLCRLGCRVRDRRLLARAFGVTTRRNAAAVAVLALECLVLGAWLR